ncbi:MAG: hypothetical protein AAF682_28530 [Planctomycetota bacterium]
MKQVGILVTVLVGTASCSVVPTASITPRYGPLEVDGDVGVSSLGTVATTDAESLGMEDDDSVFSPRADMSWLNFDAWASWYDARFAGNGIAEGQLDLGGVVIGIDDPVVSELDMFLASGAVTWDLVPSDLIDVGVGLGYGLVDFDAEIRSLTTGAEIGTQESFGLPLLAARGAVDFGDIEASLVVAGLAVKADGDEISMLDGDLMVRWYFLNAGPAQGGIALGWRLTRVEAEYGQLGSRLESDLAFSGPYAGLTIQL